MRLVMLRPIMIKEHDTRGFMNNRQCTVTLVVVKGEGDVVLSVKRRVYIGVL